MALIGRVIPAMGLVTSANQHKTLGSRFRGNDEPRWTLAVLELRLALPNERAHPFLLIVERERRVEFPPLEQEPLGKR